MQNSETNSANSASQTLDTAINGNDPTRTRAVRRIDATNISEIARLCARQLSESEACRKLGIKPQAWFSWKARHSRSEKFAALLEEFRAGRIDSLITKIESAADGVNMKQPDWRAAAALLKFADIKRFGDSPVVEVNSQIQWHGLGDREMGKIRELFLAKNNLKLAPDGRAVTVESTPAPDQIQDAEIVPDIVL